MMDIVERLRSPEVFITDGGLISPVASEAADEIERLREAIQKITDGIYIAKFYAEDALKEKSDGLPAI